MPNIDEIWRRIERHEGEEFHTKKGLPFTYAIQGEIFRSSRANRNIPRRDFEKALKIAPFDGPGDLNRMVQGPAYVWAVLHDPRIRQRDY